MSNWQRTAGQLFGSSAVATPVALADHFAWAAVLLCLGPATLLTERIIVLVSEQRHHKHEENLVALAAARDLALVQSTLADSGDDRSQVLAALRRGVQPSDDDAEPP